jgi:hypothetical protein
MAHRSPPAGTSKPSTRRGNRRTRGGAGRHNLKRSALSAERTGVRLCLSCDRPFKSRGAGNRICGRCRERNAEIETVHSYRIPSAMRGAIFSDLDDL